MNDLHDAEVEVGVLGVLVQLLLERAVEVDPADLGVGAARDVAEAEEVGLLQAQPLADIVQTVPVVVKITLKIFSM